MSYELLERALLQEALGLLARRDHSIRELHTKLTKKCRDAHARHPKGDRARAISAVIHDLTARGYLDDRRAALAWARRSRARWQGDARLRRDLKRRGIDGSIVDSVLEELPDNEEALQAALESYVRRRGEPTARRELQQCYGYLVRLGHSPSRVRQSLAPYFRKLGAEGVTGD